MFKQISFLLFCLVLVSCTPHNTDLQLAEQLMEHAPDSALHLLQRIPTHSNLRKADNAHYALLMSQALDKNGVKSDDDSLISIATDFYDEAQPEQAGYAWFYHSRTANNRGDAKEQAAHLLKAQEFAEQTTDYKLRGLIYGDKGLMYQSQMQFDSAVCYFDKAYNSVKLIPDNRSCIIQLINEGIAALYMDRTDFAINCFRKAEQIPLLQKDNLLKSTVYKSLGNVYYQKGDYASALHYYNKAPLTNIPIYDSNKFYLLAKTTIQLGDFEIAKAYLQNVKELRQMAPDYYRLWQMISEREGNQSKALFYANHINSATDSLYKLKLETSFAGLEKKYKYQGLQLTNTNLIIKDKQKSMLLLIALLSLSIFGITMLVWRLKVKKAQLKIQEQLLDVEKSLVQTEKEKFEKVHENNLLLEKQLKLQSIILLNIEQHRKNAVLRPTSAKLLTKEAKQQQNNVFYQELIACMDLEYNNISHRLKVQYPSLTSQDIQIACLLLAGFETGMIATIIDVKIESMHVNRSRLRKKLNLSKSMDLVDFILHF